MKRGMVFLSGLVTFAVLSTFLYAFSKTQSTNALFLANKADNDLAFTLNSQNAPENYGSNVDVVATRKGNNLKFNYVGASASSGNHAALSAGGYIQNVERLYDLTSLTISGNGSFKLHTGWEGYGKVQDFELNNSSETFSLTNVSYFKIEAVISSIIESINGDYTCTADAYPALTKVQTSGKWDRAAYWNIAAHDVDPTKEFDFSYSIRQIYTGSDRVQRPRLAIINGDDLYDENYSVKTANDVCVNPYYVVRQDSWQTTILGGATTEKAIGNADSWLSASTGTKNAVNYIDNTNFHTVSSDATATFTMSLRNKEGGGQEFTCVLFIDTNVEDKQDITITYKVTRNDGIIFDASNIAIAIIVGGWNNLTTYSIVGSSSNGLR